MIEEKARRDIADSIFRRAAELYGQERAQALRPNLEQMVAHLWLLSTKAPPRDVAPAFFM